MDVDGGQTGRPTARRKMFGVTAVAVLAAAAVAGIGRAVLDGTAAPQPSTTVSIGTAPVTRGNVSEREQIPGVLGFDGSYQVAHEGAGGVLTVIATPGSTVDRGGTLYAVADRPVRLLLGTVPAYRDFAAGMPDGPDVKELEQNLAALGYHPGTVDDHFSAATATAIRAWQKDWGWSASRRSGALPLGSVVFAPVKLRISAGIAALGNRVGPGTPVLSATSTTRVVTAQLAVAEQGLVRAGDDVQVALAGMAPTSGVVLRVGRVASAPSPAPGAPNEPSVAVTIRVTMPQGSADLDQAPVLVSITTEEHEDVLLVPVLALLARPGGGYQVRLPTGEYVQVQPGLFDSGASTVEVTGDLNVGQLVQVPAS